VSIGSHQQCVGKSQVHLTPRWILDRLGMFDLDPCAATVRPWDIARRNLVEADDGLSAEWLPEEEVFLNPPFNRYLVALWVQKLADHGNGILLLHARTETEWFVPVWSADLIVFLSKRVTFCKPDGTPCTVTNARTGKVSVANSGAPVVLAAYGAKSVARLYAANLPGHYIAGSSVDRVAA
jgi:hypothetical protein